MALNSTSLFASFDITDGSQDRDISPILAKALYLDLNFLGNINVDFSNPVHDVIHYWNEDALNTDTVTVSGSVASNGTSITATSATHTFHIGDLIYDTTKASTEIMQVSNVSTVTISVSRAYNSTTAASIADAAVLAKLPAEQEGSDIGTDRTVAPTVRYNRLQIIPGNDILITGTQLARKMATNELADQLAHQLTNRALEFKKSLTRTALYSEISAAGSDTVYRTMGGMRYWNATGSGLSDSTSGAWTYAQLNSLNTSVVNKGKYPDTLLVGTDLVATIAGWDASYRRLRESDKQVGYMVNEVLLAQGNTVQVVVDGRVKSGDYFLFNKDQVRLLPMEDRAMFVIAATDFADAKKRRLLGEWTLEVRNPETLGYGYNKS